MKIGIDLTWLKPNKSGGVESYIRNLLDGFLELGDDNKYILLMAKDNYQSFEKYKKDARIETILCNTNANDIKGHLIWQNLHQYNVLKKNKLDFCFFPVYEMPIYKNRKIRCVTTIHDIQAYHYPKYFSKLENIWFKLGWEKAIKNANRIVTISDFTKHDIENHFKHAKNIKRIYIPIVLNDKIKCNFNQLSKKYNIQKNQYYYTVCSLHKHKNLITLINVMEEIIKKEKKIPNILVISGVGGPQKKELENIIFEKKLEKNVILTSFVSNEERNSLIENSNIFLFPSLFEGFGMPPVEAMMLGAKVITTKCTSLYEVTDKKCEYVEDPLSTQEWINKIKEIQNMESKKYDFTEYDKKHIARQYLDLFYEVNNEKR
ncbi:MAG: glycosyltransferase family 1 protein [bacterium]|nr:glycosyltransferase family 1 protein [bacterium]